MASSFSCLPDLFRLPVITLKRLWAGDMTQDRIAAEMQAARPGVICCRMTGGSGPYRALLEGEYRLIYEDGEHRLYALKSVIKQANQ